MNYSGSSCIRPPNIWKNWSYNGGGHILEVIFSMIKHILLNKTRSDNGGGLILEVPLYMHFDLFQINEM